MNRLFNAKFQRAFEVLETREKRPNYWKAKDGLNYDYKSYIHYQRPFKTFYRNHFGIIEAYIKLVYYFVTRQ